MSAISRTVRQRWSTLPVYCLPVQRAASGGNSILPRHASSLPLRRPFSSVSTPPPQAPPPPTFPTQYFSGIQPTGVLHIGNYLGAIQPWLNIQHQLQSSSPTSSHPTTSPTTANKLLISVVDLHAITVPQSPATLRATSMELATFLLACGLKPSHTTLFLQSHVAAHSELTWLLSCVTPHAWLNHMTQYKEKSKSLLTALNASTSASHTSSTPFPTSTPTASLGLYSYPLLMAADILLYRTTVVPVGNDQSQHLELTRNIAQRFNDTYTSKQPATSCPSLPTPYFPLPQTLTSDSARVMSLRDPLKKMSKSDPLPSSRVTFNDSDDTIRAHLRRAVTDSIDGLSLESIGQPERAGVRNLLDMLAACSGQSVEQLVASGRYERKSALKEATAEAVIGVVRPVREEWARLKREQGWVEQVLKDGAREAEEKAIQTLREVKSLMGIVNRF